MQHIRNFNVDLIKSLAIWLVIMQHAWSMLDLDNPALGLVCSVYRSISTMGVPLFVFASGVLLLSQETESLIDFYKKRFSRLLIPFFIFALLMYVMSLMLGKYDWWNGDFKTAILQFIPSLLENKINILHWFVHMMFMLYLLTPFLQTILHKLSQNEIRGILFVWVLVMLLQQYYPTMYILFYVSNLWKYLGIYIVGYYVNKYCIGKKIYFYVGLIFTILILFINIVTDCVISLGVPFAALMIGIMLLNIPMLDTNSFCHKDIFIQISRYTYTIYLTHVLVISVIYLSLNKLFPYIMINYRGGYSFDCQYFCAFTVLCYVFIIR